MPDISASTATNGQLSQRQASCLRRTFIDTISQVTAANAGSPEWWLTWLSSRDRFRPRLWDRMRVLAKLSAAREAGKTVDLSRLDLPTADVVRSWNTPRRSGSPKLLSVLSRGIGWLIDAIVLAKHVRLALKRLAAARRFPAKLSGAYDVIIVTILTEAAVTRDGPYADVYFGRLHQWLADVGQRVIFCGFPEGHAERIVAGAVQRDDVDILTYGHLLTRRDVVRTLARALSVRFRVPPLPLPWGGDAGPLVRADIRFERCSIFDGILIRRAMDRLLARQPEARLIHMYENNGWERANYQAAKAAVPPRSVTGYLHCAVLRSHLKNTFPSDEHGTRPMPDRVVTTGPAARELLMTFGDYPDGLLADGCGLRLPSLSDMVDTEPAQRPVRSVLAVFEGLMSVAPALRLFAEAARRRPDLRFLVRCHPQLPIERLAPAAGVAYGPDASVDVSRPASLVEAVAEADAIAYVSSTAVLYALYAGRPVIKLDVDETVDDDPLTACPAFKFRASTPADLLLILGDIDAMSDMAATQAAEAARGYLDRYLREPDSATAKPFLSPPILADAAGRSVRSYGQFAPADG